MITCKVLVPGRWTAAIIFVAFFILSSCRKDVFVATPQGLAGDYTGVYSWRDKSSTQASQVQAILWRFATGYTMIMDSTLQTERKFCDVQGTFELTDAVVLNQLKPNLTAQMCDTSQNPTGAFTILKRTQDTLHLAQQIGSIAKDIVLARKQP